MCVRGQVDYVLIKHFDVSPKFMFERQGQRYIRRTARP